VGAVQIFGAVWRLVVDYCCLRVPLLLHPFLLLLLLGISQSMLLLLFLETPHALQTYLRQVLYPLYQHQSL